MRKVIPFLIFLTLSSAVFATNPIKKGDETKACVFSGKVLDKSNLEALTGAVIEIKDLGKSAYASFDGSFAFENLPSGTYTVVVKYIGYADQTFEKVKISTASKDSDFRLTAF